MFRNQIKLIRPKLLRDVCRAIKTNAEESAVDSPKTTNLVQKYIANEPHLIESTKNFPKDYLRVITRGSAQYSYLIDPYVAEDIATLTVNSLALEDKDTLNQPIICLSNPGMGFIASELLNKGVSKVRLYEPSGLFRPILKEQFNHTYPGRFQLFTKNFFSLPKLAYLDQIDGGNRTEQLFKDVPVKNWEDEPAITVIGDMPHLSFIDYLLQIIALQSDIIMYGRIQLFALLQPLEYFKLIAKPEHLRRIYTPYSVYFDLFFDYKLLNVYPREVFVPWQSEKRLSRSYIERHSDVVDRYKIYFLQINLKRNLPMDPKTLLYFHHFIKQVLSKTKIIQKLETWFPGVGLKLLSSNEKLLKNLTIYTEFSELSPPALFSLFHALSDRLSEENNIFVASVQNKLLHKHTIDTDQYKAAQQKTNSEPLEEDLGD